ncbi:MAG: preprotein translocase subunit SecA [Patescibacteria group bacterium]
MPVFSKIFGDRILKRLKGVISSVNELEEGLKIKSDEDLKKESLELKAKIKNGENLENALPKAFALVRESARRKLGQRHFDAQLVGGAVLHEGKIAEMLTGEGKTLAATLPAYLNALAGKGVHVVTVNDYLAKRDAVWMGQIYQCLGLSVACLIHDSALIYDPTHTREKFQNPNSKSQINSNNQNSNDKNDLDRQRDVLGSFKVFEEFLRPITRKEAYEADITYGTNHEFGFDFLRDNLRVRPSDRVQKSHYFAIIDEVDSILVDEARTPLIIAAPDMESSNFYKTFAKVVERLSPEEDYIVNEKDKFVNITETGIEKVEKMVGVKNIFAPENARLVHFMQESLKARALFKRDKDYVLRNNEIIIVDEFTGRMLLGRRYSGGLHQAIEAKEGIQVKEENRTYAQITIQNYFRLYKKIAGMTGTAQTSAEEFHKVYNLEVISIPPNRPMVRKDSSDLIYKSKKAKYDAVVEEVKARHKSGQPVLLGTTSISNNEIISDLLKSAGVPHEILNAKNHEREGEIIAQAGKLGAVTVATNMAGRGVDIVLGGNPMNSEEAEKVKKLGGLCVIGTERHESRRIDNQLRGRSGRQGDPGGSRFFLSLEDDLLRIFGGDKLKNLMQTLKFPEDMPIESRFVSKAVNQAQSRVEGLNLDLRKHLLEYDDVLNKQRSAIYKKRSEFIDAGEKNEIRPILFEILNKFGEIQEIKDKIGKLPEVFESQRSALIGEHFVRILDTLWVNHLENLEALRESVNIRAYGQHEPLVEYRREAHILYQDLSKNFEELVSKTVWPMLEIDLAKIRQVQDVKRVEPPPEAKNIGRNDPCWCGVKHPDGRPIKYKHCHGKNI